MDIAFRIDFAEARSVYDGRTPIDAAVEAGLGAEEVRNVLADPTAYAEEVRADERLAAELGASGVPFFVLDRRYGVGGVQSPEAFTRALEQAWADRPAGRPPEPARSAMPA